jgi:hypothetical protein
LVCSAWLDRGGHLVPESICSTETAKLSRIYVVRETTGRHMRMFHVC